MSQVNLSTVSLRDLPVTEDNVRFSGGCIYKPGFYGGNPHIFIYPCEVRRAGGKLYIAYAWSEKASPLAFATEEGCRKWLKDEGYEEPTIDQCKCRQCGNGYTMHDGVWTCFGSCYEKVGKQ